MKYVLLISLLWPLLLYSQWSEDFSDGNFSLNPTWLGDVDSFEVISGLLHLNAPANNQESYLVSSSTAAVGGAWEFYVRLEFNPSSSNRLMVYVMSDSTNLKGPSNAYYIMIGNSSDEVSLYKQKGSISTKLIDGIDGFCNENIVELRIKLTRDLYGNFELWADSSQNLNNYQSQGQVNDAEFMSSAYFGLLCDYTATRSDKFYFDDVEISAGPFVDSFPPVLISANVLSLNEINLQFNEALDSAFASDVGHYLLNASLNPIFATSNGSEITLSFSQHFSAGPQSLLLTFQDLDGNLNDTLVSIEVIDNLSFESILFNEVYADETPSYGMPAYEFIELFNPLSDTMILQDCSLSDATDTVSLPYFTLPPDSLIILCKTTAISEYEVFGRTLGVPNFPSLNNSGDALLLLNKYLLVVDSFTYNLDFYRNEEDSLGNRKKDGGYSLERRLQPSLCSIFYSWHPAISPSGASPGKANSIDAVVFPSISLKLESVLLEDDTTLLLHFSEELPFIDQSNVRVAYNSYQFQGENEVEQAFVLPGTTDMYVLVEDPILFSTSYTLNFSQVQDCYGNLMSDFSFGFYRFEEPVEGDLVINEILFNPLSGGSDYIELYNKSNKFIKLEDLKIVEYDVLEPTVIIDEEKIKDFVLAPFSFLVLTEDTQHVLAQYPVANKDALKQNALPNFNDDESIVVLKTSQGFSLDSIHYQSSWHLELLDLKDGVALERLDVNGPSNNADNWSSAAKTFSYGTPTAVNSQYFEGNLAEKAGVQPEVFSPNEDGYNDYCMMYYHSDKGGELATITIYNLLGQEVKLLAQNHSLGSENTWKWTGVDNDFEKAEVGIYVVLFEIFDIKGQVKRIKKKVVLGANLN